MRFYSSCILEVTEILFFIKNNTMTKYNFLLNELLLTIFKLKNYTWYQFDLVYVGYTLLLVDVKYLFHSNLYGVYEIILFIASEIVKFITVKNIKTNNKLFGIKTNSPPVKWSNAKLKNVNIFLTRSVQPLYLHCSYATSCDLPTIFSIHFLDLLISCNQ